MKTFNLNTNNCDPNAIQKPSSSINVIIILKIKKFRTVLFSKSEACTKNRWKSVARKRETHRETVHSLSRWRKHRAIFFFFFNLFYINPWHQMGTSNGLSRILTPTDSRPNSASIHAQSSLKSVRWTLS